MFKGACGALFFHQFIIPSVIIFFHLVYCYGDNFCNIFSQKLQTIDYLRTNSWKPWFVSSLNIGNIIFERKKIIASISAVQKYRSTNICHLISLSGIVIIYKISWTLQIYLSVGSHIMTLRIKTIKSILKV